MRVIQHWHASGVSGVIQTESIMRTKIGRSPRYFATSKGTPTAKQDLVDFLNRQVSESTLHDYNTALDEPLDIASAAFWNC